MKDIFSKCDQIHRKLRIWSHSLKKSLMENFIFCSVLFADQLTLFFLFSFRELFLQIFATSVTRQYKAAHYKAAELTNFMIQCDIYVTGRTSKTSFTKENIIEVDTYNKAAFPLKVFVESLAQITVFANTFSFSLININQNIGDSNFVQTFSHKL